MFRIGEELDDNLHSSSSSSVGLFNSNREMMSKNQSQSEADFSQEISIFGNFDPDDPDFCVIYSSGHSNVSANNSSSILSRPNNRLTNSSNTLPSRPSSRQSFGRNNSSNSLKRTKSTNSMGGSRFYIGTSIT